MYRNLFKLRFFAPTGMGKMTYKNNNIYEGEWKFNKRNGLGFLQVKEGNKYKILFDGQWVNNRFVCIRYKPV